MYHQKLESGLEKPEAPVAAQVEILFPEEHQEVTSSKLTSEEIDQLYKDDPEDPSVQLYQQR
jgi:hypothetical protein